MDTENYNPTSLLDAVRHFSDPDVCHNYMIRVLWTDKRPCCPKCESEKIGEIKSRRMFQCKDCRKQFSTKLGTIFEDSPLGLDKWFVAVWAIANAKNGISSCELARALGVTQKTAWHMLHRIRLAMKTKSFRKITGEIEVDETFLGGCNSNRHKNKRKGGTRTGNSDKVIVQGLLQRGGEIRCHIARNLGKKTLQAPVRENVEIGSHVYSDQFKSYISLSDDFIHQTVNHIVEYVNGRVHINGLENFWSLLKRTLAGTYVSVAPRHMDRYLDEQTWRFNKRKGSDGTRFLEVMLSVAGKRLTYADLIGRAAKAA